MGKKWEKVAESGTSMVFRGRYPRSLDTKGRLMLPPEFRDAMALRAGAHAAAGGASSSAPAAGTFVLTTYDGCLVAFSWDDWVELEEKFMRIPNPSPKVRAFRRLVIGGAETHTPDAHGRILLTPDHSAYACLDREATVLGLVERYEIWNTDALERKSVV